MRTSLFSGIIILVLRIHLYYTLHIYVDKLYKHNHYQGRHEQKHLSAVGMHLFFPPFKDRSISLHVLHSKEDAYE